MIADNNLFSKLSGVGLEENKNIILTPKMKITPRDYEEIPEDAQCVIVNAPTAAASLSAPTFVGSS